MLGAVLKWDMYQLALGRPGEIAQPRVHASPPREVISSDILVSYWAW